MNRVWLVALTLCTSTSFAQSAPAEPAAREPPAGDEAQSAPPSEPAAVAEQPAAEQPAPQKVEAQPAAEQAAVKAVSATADSTASSAEAAATAPDSGAAKIAAVAPAPPAEKKKGFVIGLDGYLRTEFSTFTNDRFFFIKMPSDGAARRNPEVGRNDAFALGSARLNVRATFRDKLYVRLGFDGAVANYKDDNSPIGTLSTGLKDAYLRYTFGQALQAYAGRFKPPYDISELTPEEDLLFVRRPVESRGVLRHEGFAGDVPGFAPGRQVGVMLTSPSLFTLEPMAIGYAAAVTNGNAGDATLNDNDLPALWLRLEARWGKDRKPTTDEEGPATFDVNSGGLVGLGGFYNELTFGTAPNRFRDRVVGAGLDFAVRESVFDVRGQILWSRTEHLLRFGAQAEHSLGGHLELGVVIPNTMFTPAYRVAYYDPRDMLLSSDLDAVDLAGVADIDRVVHHSVGLRIDPPDLPLVGWVDYTHSIEQGGRSIPNDRVEAALQVSFE